MTRLGDARNIASGTALVLTAETLLVQGLGDLLRGRGGIDRQDIEILGDALVNLRGITSLITDALDSKAEMPAITLAWLGLDVSGKSLSDPVAKLIELGVEPRRAQQAA